MTIEIFPFETQYAAAFYDLNAVWLEKYFYIEPYDEKVLRNPERFIIQNGGFIFFAKVNNELIGTVALINQGTYYELSKMAVNPAHQGKKIGLQLMNYCVEFGRSKEWKSITLYSHRKLVPAITLYKKIGFQEIPLEADSHYERSNIKMLLKL